MEMYRGSLMEPYGVHLRSVWIVWILLIDVLYELVVFCILIEGPFVGPSPDHVFIGLFCGEASVK